MSVTFNPNPVSGSAQVNSALVDSVSAATIQSYLQGETILSAQEVVDCVAQEPELQKLYQLFAGVGEGYSVEDHTRMVVESFEKEFLPRADVQEILRHAGLTPEQMILFLALHDIGKGRAVEEIYNPCPARKEKELRYTQEVIEEFATKWNLGTEAQIFLQLLNDDAVGDLLKLRNPSEANIQETIEAIQVAAGNCRAAGYPTMSDSDFLKLKTIFHQVDAASYPFVRNRFFQTDRSQPIQLGRSVVGWYQDYSQDNLNKMARLKSAMTAQIVG